MQVKHKSIASFVQIENLLISNQGTIKLCDFGSSTTVSHYPDYSWSAQKRSMVEDEVCVHSLSFINLNPYLTAAFCELQGKNYFTVFSGIPRCPYRQKKKKHCPN